MSAIRLASVAVMVLCSWAIPADARAGPAVVACGDTITVDLVLANDLVDCPAVGLVVGADGITIDLNGHTIDGDLGAAELGIDNTAGHSGLTVHSGTIAEFVEGIIVVGGEGHHFHHLITAGMLHLGVYVAGGTNTRVNRLRSVDSCGAVVIEGGGRVRVDHNVVLGQSCVGVAVYDAYLVRIDHNEINGSPDSPIHGDAIGIGLFGATRNSVVRSNSVIRHGFAGLRIEGADWNRIVDNDVAHNSIGMTLIGHHNTLRSNVVRATGLVCHDPDGGCGFGISFEGGTDNLIENNRVLGSARIGISAGTYLPETPPSRDTIIRANVVRRTAGDGIRVAANVRGTVVDANVVGGSGRDGIDVNDRRTTVSGNRAFHNGDRGIEGVAGMTDGGGNRARDNGDPRQCTFVHCR